VRSRTVLPGQAIAGKENGEGGLRQRFSMQRGEKRSREVWRCVHVEGGSGAVDMRSAREGVSGTGKGAEAAAGWQRGARERGKKGVRLGWAAAGSLLWAGP
jgi:hypothetical protein